ncbi:MAG: hydantoinase/oxoprolinase family protein [Methanimicrococcus sp.]|nr:hydantoinase/oxoprolinase family protein [Methanimicrococcus sp.]
MVYNMGIDAGGTYTDAAIIRESDGVVVASSKAFTTYPDPIGGIKDVLCLFEPALLKEVTVVSLSTTLSTNTVLEDTGFPVGLILIGDYKLPEAMPAQYYCVVAGGHDSNGEEIHPLDIEAVRSFALSVQDKVSAFAVSSLFSMRNADHELAVKKEIFELTGQSVVCGHELSQDLGAYDRAITAFLNARLIPVTDYFIKSVSKELQNLEMDAVLLMLKCDGSAVGIDEALEKPIEMIFSGPAASLMGASYLSGLGTCAMIDIGGTSTDVALLENSLPIMDDSGACVGGWSTRVKAIRMNTVATGGDSHVFSIEEPNMTIYIGPHRMIPLCRASILYDGFLKKLENTKLPPRKFISEFISPAVFFVRTKNVPIELTSLEEIHLDLIDSDFPISWSDLFDRLDGKMPMTSALESLVQKRLIQAIGFTPTDALHITGDFNEWDAQASLIGAQKIDRLTRKNPQELALYVKNRVAKNMAAALIEYLVPGILNRDVEKILSGKYHTQFAVSTPIVLIGASSRVYADELRHLIHGEFLTPPFSDVGNAVGALVGQGVYRTEVLVKMNKLKEGNKDAVEYLVFHEGERQIFLDSSTAIENAIQIGKESVFSKMRKSGLKEDQISISHSQKELFADSGSPLEMKFAFIGVATHRNLQSLSHIPDFVKFINPEKKYR